MAYIKHNAIVVTSWNPEAIESAKRHAEQCGCTVTNLVKSPVNGFFSFLIATDGGNDGHYASENGNNQRQSFKEWLSGYTYEDGSSSLEWCEVVYGSDDRSASVVAHAWGKTS